MLPVKMASSSPQDKTASSRHFSWHNRSFHGSVSVAGSLNLLCMLSRLVKVPVATHTPDFSN